MNYKIEYSLKYNAHSSIKKIIIKNCNSVHDAETKFFKYIAKKNKNAIVEILNISEDTNIKDNQILNNLKNIMGID